MCGLYGFKTDPKLQLTDYQRQKRAGMARGLAVAMQSRGTDSTGIAALVNNKIEIHKDILPANEFIERRRVQSLLLHANTVIGHTRLATHGAVTQPNAHPYHYGRIVGAHNGVVHNAMSLDPSKEVDSMVIFDQLDKANNDAKQAFSKLSGMFALTWIDAKNPNNLQFAVHNNPLFWFVDPNLHTIFWASTELALSTVRAAVGIGKDSTIYYPIEDKTYTIKEWSGDAFSYTSESTPFAQYVWSSYPKKDASASGIGNINDDFDRFALNEMYRAEQEIEDEWERELDELEQQIVSCDWCMDDIYPKLDGYYFNENTDSVICNFCGRQYAQELNFQYIPPEPEA